MIMYLPYSNMKIGNLQELYKIDKHINKIVQFCAFKLQ